MLRHLRAKAQDGVLARPALQGINLEFSQGKRLLRKGRLQQASD